MSTPARVLAGLSLAGVLLSSQAQPAWETPLATTGDAARGQAIVIKRQEGLCLLCHSGPFPQEPFQGNLAPTLSGVGARLSSGQLRLRMMDSRQVNPDSIMPPYFETRGLQRVGSAFSGKTLLTAQQIEDVVAFLQTLQ
jgi:sulfur-oxidizing protein SoxX